MLKRETTMNSNSLRNDQAGLPATLDITVTAVEYTGAAGAGRDGRLAGVGISVAHILDMLGLACLAIAACALLNILYVDELVAEAVSFEVFRLALMSAVGGFLVARGLQIMQLMRDEPRVPATVLPAPVPLFDERAGVAHEQRMERAA